MRNPFRRRRETLREMQARLAVKLGYVPLVFGTDAEGDGKSHRAYWDVKAQKWQEVRSRSV